ncbi:MAG: hypothetical protein ACYDAQ_16640 [Mycobacteriales bacterium]
MSGATIVSGATFDTGMLVALDHNEREAWVVLRRLVNRGEVPTVPTVVAAQAWRDGQRWRLGAPRRTHHHPGRHHPDRQLTT